MHGGSSPQGGVTRFVEWEERFVSNDRGSRVVHYYLKDRQGVAALAVVGTERSVRHMVYVVCDEFLPLAGLDKSTTAAFKWRARREVVDWLSSLLTTKSCGSSPCRSNSHVSVETGGMEDDPDAVKRLHDAKKFAKNVFWVGSSWTCRKRLKHFKSFRRNGITIAVKSFVFVMSEEKEHHIAYIEDMYEDKKQRKKLRIRWFHKTSELGCKIPAPPPHPREVFFTQFAQVISVECVDGLATVLAPDHFDRCPVYLPDSLELTHVCSRQFDGDGIKPLNICDVEGYWDQKALAAIGVTSSRGTSDVASDDDEDENGIGNRNVGSDRGPRLTRYRRRANSNSSTPTTDGEGNGLSDVDPTRASFEVGERVEVLCQDSGVRGCWFIGVVIGKTSRRVRVRYDDLQDDDGKENLQEWVSTLKLAQADKLNIRARGRSALRPCPTIAPEDKVPCSYGTPVDVWWNDGWWEGVVINRVTANDVRVHFPDEGDTEVVKTSDIRLARDWVHGQWCSVKADPDAVSALGIVCSSIDPLAASQKCRYQEDSRLGERMIERLISIAEAAQELREEDDADKFVKCSSDDESKRKRSGSNGGGGGDDDCIGGGGALKCKHSKEASVEESDCEPDTEQEGWNLNKKPRLNSGGAAANAGSIRSPPLKSSSTMFGSPLPPVASLVLSR